MDTFSSIFSSPLFSKLAGPAATVCCVLFALFIFWRRADSLHAVWEKAWRLVAGNAEVQEPRLRAFMQEARDLEKFRLVYGLRIMNMADMHRFMAWARRHRLDVVTLQKARRWVDITKPSIISRPPKYHFTWNVVVCVLSALSVQLGAFFADSPALLKMKATGVWFTADGTSVAGPFGGNKLDLTQCPTVSDKLQKTFGFSAAEAKVLCDARASGSLQEFTKETIGWQKKVAAFVVLASAAWLLVAILRIRSAETAERIADRVGLPKLTAPQVLESQPVAAAHSAVPPPTEQTS